MLAPSPTWTGLQTVCLRVSLGLGYRASGLSGPMALDLGRQPCLFTDRKIPRVRVNGRRDRQKRKVTELETSVSGDRLQPDSGFSWASLSDQ